MKTITRKIVAFAMAMMLMLSVGIIGIAATETEQIIYFEVPTDWESFSDIYCHIFPYGGDPLANWQTKKEQCTATDTEGVYSYDITKAGGISQGVTYGVIFSADTGKQTYTSLMGYECIGDTLYVDTDVIMENPDFSLDVCYGALWRNQPSLKYGPVLRITSMGEVEGTALLPGQTCEDIFSQFIAENLVQVRTNTGKTDQEIIDDIASALNLDAATVDEILQESGVAVEYNGKLYGDATSSTDEITYKYYDIIIPKVFQDYELEDPEFLIYYYEVYEYYSPDNMVTGDEATPDYVLISLSSNMVMPMPTADVFGDYVLYGLSIEYPFTYGYGIYIPSTEEIYDLTVAYELQIEGIENVFTKATIGKLIGDMDGDRKLTVKDATYIQKCIAELAEYDKDDLIDAFDSSENPPLLYVSDFNHDCERNIKDATAIQKHIAGLEY